MLDKLNWSSLEHRRKNQRLTTMFKIVRRLVAVPTSYLTPADSRNRAIHIYTSSGTYRHPQQLTKIFSSPAQSPNGTASTKTSLKHLLWAASRAVYRSPPHSTLAWHPKIREFADYVLEPEVQYCISLQVAGAKTALSNTDREWPRDHQLVCFSRTKLRTSSDWDQQRGDVSVCKLAVIYKIKKYV